MALPLMALALGLASGFLYEKNEPRLKALVSKKKLSAPALPPLSADTQTWLQAQTPQDQALFGQMMASGSFAVGQYYDPSQYASMYGLQDPYGGAGYDPSQFGGLMGYDPSQLGMTYGSYDPNAGYGGYDPNVNPNTGMPYLQQGDPNVTRRQMSRTSPRPGAQSAQPHQWGVTRRPGT